MCCESSFLSNDSCPFYLVLFYRAIMTTVDLMYFSSGRAVKVSLSWLNTGTLEEDETGKKKKNYCPSLQNVLVVRCLL